MRYVRDVISPIFTVGGFLLGCYFALSFSRQQLAPVWDRYKLIPTIVSADSQVLEFKCRDQDCVSCLQGVRDNPRSIVFTGASAFRYGLDLDAFAKSMPLPVVSCIRNDSRVDAYEIFFKHVHFNQPDQVMFHGYNSWGINSAATWAGGAPETFFATRPPPPEPPSRTSFRQRIPPWSRPFVERYWRVSDGSALALLLANIFLTRGMAEAPNRWRLEMKNDYPIYRELNVDYWPLSKETHLGRRVRLMRRWFGLSAWVQSFIIDMDELKPREEIAARHEQFMRTMAPTRRFVFLPAPELTEVFPDHVKKVMDESRAVMLETLAKHSSVLHVDVNYRACGIETSDFWLQGAMFFDPAHADEHAKPRITQCIIDALKKADIDRFISES